MRRFRPARAGAYVGPLYLRRDHAEYSGMAYSCKYARIVHIHVGAVCAAMRATRLGWDPGAVDSILAASAAVFRTV